MHLQYSAYILAILLSLYTGCRQVDERSMEVDVPALANTEVQQKITAALAPLTGVRRDSLAFDLQKHKLTLRYDSMQCAKKNIEIAIAEAGFEANGMKPVPKDK